MTIDYRNPGSETQALLLAKYLPGGRLWNAKWTRDRVLGRLVAAFAGEIGRLFDVVERFVTIELDPNKTRELLLEWEKSVQIPDKCFGRADTVDERRQRVAQKLANFDNVITIEDFDEFMDSFGQVVEFVPGSATNAEKLGFGAPPYTTQELKEIRHTLAVRVEGDAPVFPLSFPIPFFASSAGLLDCLVRRITPANVDVQFFFNEDLDFPFVVPDTTLSLPVVISSRQVQSISFTSQPNLVLAETTRTSSGAQALGITEDAPAIIEPGDIAGLELDLDAADAASITESGGDVSEWDDTSGAGNSLTQATAVRQPTTSAINGNSSILFDGDATQGDADLLRDSSASITSPPATIAIVLTPTSVAAGLVDILKFREGFNEIFTIQRSGTNIQVVEGQGGGVTVMSVNGVLAANETRWVIVRFRNSGDGLSDMVTDENDTDSASVSASISTAIDDINIGANANGADAFAGHIHRILYWNRFVSDTERDDIAAYLNDNWTVS